MKCTIPEISWHNRDPVLSIDIQPIFNEEFYRLASGGTDCHVLIWYLKIRENGAVDVDIVSDLSRHQRAVNVVRWAPSGQYLATGDDDANIIIWNLKTDNIPLLEGETADKEIWVVNKILRGHKEDVYDICWSPSGKKLLSGSIDNTAILWDFSKGQNEYILTDHKGFVQGVTWDPKGQYIATLSSDRVCRIFDNSGRIVKARTHKGMLPVPESHFLFNKEVKYFHDDTFKSYFRRLSFSPDGSLLIAPSGCIEADDYKDSRHATFIFTLDCLTQPAAILPSPKQVTIAVRCCPILFELRSEGADPIIALPYRIVIAVATDSDVVLYDTQQLTPFAHLRKIHYTRITDLTWSSDGLLLIASSTDGFCTLITFELDELGLTYVKEDSEVEESILDVSGCEEIDKVELNKKRKESESCEVKVKKPTILDQWALRNPKKCALPENMIESSSKLQENATIITEPESIVNTRAKEAGKPVTSEPRKLVPKRIVPIRVVDIQKVKNPCTITSKNNTSETVLDTSKKEENREKGDTNTDNTVLQQTSSCNDDDDVIIIDDSFNNDSVSKASPGNKKGNILNKSKSKKRNADIKKNQTPVKNNPLLQFLQAAKKKSTEYNANNKCTSNAHISKDSACATIDDKASNADNVTDKIVYENRSEMQTECSRTITTDNVIEIEDSDSNASQTSICKIVDQSSIIKEVSDTDRPIPEKSNAEECSASNIDMKTSLTEKENLKMKEIASVDICSTEKPLREDSVRTETCKPLNSTSIVKTPTSKTPRRIPFVTLSSPKRKKKE